MSERLEQNTQPLSPPLPSPPPLSPRLSIYRWHPGMIASIAHRGTGVVLALFVPLYLFLLYGMAGSATNFTTVFGWLHSGMGKFSLWLTGAALIYHFCNGIRFLMMDAGWGEGRSHLRNSAKIAMAIGTVAALLLAVLL